MSSAGLIRSAYNKEALSVVTDEHLAQRLRFGFSGFPASPGIPIQVIPRPDIQGELVEVGISFKFNPAAKYFKKLSSLWWFSLNEK